MLGDVWVRAALPILLCVIHRDCTGIAPVLTAVLTFLVVLCSHISMYVLTLGLLCVSLGVSSLTIWDVR